MTRHNDRGFATMLLSLLVGTGVLVVMAALVVDIGARQVERRELQNGAEAAAMAVAFQCSFPNNATYVCSQANALEQANARASANARDSASSTDAQTGDVCFSSGFAGTVSALTTCSRPRSTLNCPRSPSQSQWVQVTATTLRSSGSRLMPQFFSRMLPGNAGRAVQACAQAAWGPPAGNAATVFPLALQWRCWDAQVSSPNGYGPPRYSNANSTTYERWFKLTTGGTDAGCYGSSDLSAGFGWLNFALTSCSTASGASFSYGTWAQMDTGNNMPTLCKTPISAPTAAGSVLNKVIVIPIYDCAWQSGGAGGTSWGSRYSTDPLVRGTTCAGLAPAGTPNGRYYRIAGFAPYLLTGFFYGSGTDNGYYDGLMSPPALSPTRLVDPNGAAVCHAATASSERCFYGWFTQQSLITSGEIGDNNTGYFGLNVVKLVG